ncbi:uncharacterized protein LOC121421761 [Lytechinus variegatus]|uniref:uncharacterized protein LOC121421761 n=1 Tax=Lytechinus variegatus TaxID=7654 RepID=UPI001BB13D57|nr:uncharacterized protein LOC121421761 [Lytechinus variegatus]
MEFSFFPRGSVTRLGTRRTGLILFSLGALSLIFILFSVTLTNHRPDYEGFFKRSVRMPIQDQVSKSSSSDGAQRKPPQTYRPRARMGDNPNIPWTVPAARGDDDAAPALPPDMPETTAFAMNGSISAKKVRPLPLNEEEKLSRMLATSSLTNQLPNYFLHGSPEADGDKYRLGNVAFLHNVKSGGSTLKTIITNLGRKYNIQKVLIDSESKRSIFKQYEIVGRTPRQTIFVGPSTLGICEYLKDRPCSYITMVREPVSRLVSIYLFCKQTNATQCSPSSVNVSLDAWALHWGSFLFRSLITHFQRYFPFKAAANHFQNWSADFRLFAKGIQQKYPNIVTGKALQYSMTPSERRALLDHCLANLENWFAVIGLTEEFDTSLELFQEVYKLPFPKYYRGAINVGQVKKGLDSSEIERMKDNLRNNPYIMDALYDDIQIYQKAKEIMINQKLAFGLM